MRDLNNITAGTCLGLFLGGEVVWSILLFIGLALLNLLERDHP